MSFDLTGFDILVLLLMVGGAVIGLLRGLVQEVLALLAWIIVVIAVRLLHMPVTELLLEPVGSATGASMLAFASVSIVTYALCRAIVREVGKGVRKSLLSPIDRALGFGFGLIKGTVIAALLFLLIVFTINSVDGVIAARPDWLRQSRTYPLLNAVGNAIVELTGSGVDEAEAETQGAATTGVVAENPDEP
jgi:membrane protein required for colicin V production